jgi:cytochrome c oxidase assembly protein subunit 15
MVGGVLFEHGHRMIAGCVALLAWSQAAWALRRGERGWRLGLPLAAALAILAQAALGGATVLLRLPPTVSIAHACLGQTVLCLLLACAESLSPAWSTPSWGPGAWAFAALYVQLILGAILRHTGEGLALHASWAAVAFLAAGRLPVLGLVRRRGRRLAEVSSLLAALLPLQLALGYGAYRVRLSPDFETGLHAASALVTAHVAVGAAILGACAVWALRWRRPA